MKFLDQLRQIDFAALRQQISWRDIRKAILGLTAVFGGLGLALVAWWARLTENPQLAGTAAIIALVFAGLILIFVVPPLARSASREVSQIDLPLELTSGGLILFGLLAIVGFAAWNTGNNLLFIVFAFLLSTLLVSIIAAELNLRHLEVKMRLPEIAFIGETLAVSVNLRNRKFILPAFSILVGVRGRIEKPDFKKHTKIKFEPPQWAEKFVQKPLVSRAIAYFIYTSRRAATEVEANLIFPQRGRFIVKNLEISTQFPFGFWKRRQRLNTAETEIFVIPKPENLRDQIDLRSLKFGQAASRRRGNGQDLWALRDYQPNDESRHIDWKATARTRKLIVREYTAENERRITIIFDARLSQEKENSGKPRRIAKPDNGKKVLPKDEIEERFERGITLTISLLAHFITEKAEIRLIIGENFGEFGNGKNYYQDSLRRLAGVEPNFIEAEREFSDGNPVLPLISGTNSNNETVILVTAIKFETDSPNLQNLQTLYF